MFHAGNRVWKKKQDVKKNWRWFCNTSVSWNQSRGFHLPWSEFRQYSGGVGGTLCPPLGIRRAGLKRAPTWLVSLSRVKISQTEVCGYQQMLMGLYFVHPMHHVGCMASPEPHMAQGPPAPSPVKKGRGSIRYRCNRKIMSHARRVPSNHGNRVLLRVPEMGRWVRYAQPTLLLSSFRLYVLVVTLCAMPYALCPMRFSR